MSKVVPPRLRQITPAFRLGAFPRGDEALRSPLGTPLRCLSRPLAAVVVALGCSLVAAPCIAAESSAPAKEKRPPAKEEQPSAKELSIARQKFQQALALQTGGNWARALGLLKEVAEIKATPQVRFNMALCEENLGELVAALGDYELAAADAGTAGVNHVEAEATDRLEKLRKRIPKLRILPAEDAGQATFIVDGVALGESALDREMPVDPGTHVVRLESLGRAPVEQEVHVEPGETATVKFTLPPREKPKSVEELPPAKDDGTGTGRTLAYVAGGLGVATLATSGYFFLQRQNAINELDEKCPTRTNCSSEQRSLADRGKTDTLIANVSLGIGGALITTAAVLFFTTDPETRDAGEVAHRPTQRSGWASLTLSPTHERAPLGATLSGRF